MQDLNAVSEWGWELLTGILCRLRLEIRKRNYAIVGKEVEPFENLLEKRAIIINKKEQ